MTVSFLSTQGYTKEQIAFLECFSVNKKARKQIKEQIEALVERVGLQGLAEKYGFAEKVADTEADAEWRELRQEADIQHKLLHLKVSSTGLSASCFRAKYSYISDSDISTAIKDNIIRDSRIVDAWKKEQLICAIDSPDFRGLNSIYVLGNGVLIASQGNRRLLEYDDIIEISISQTALTISTYGDARPLEIRPNSEVTLDILKALRKFLIEICAEDYYLTVYNDDEEIIERIVQERIRNIVKSSSAEPYTKDSFDQNDKKLTNAIHTYAYKVQKNDVIAFIDTSLRGNGKSGLLFSKTGICFDWAFEKVFLHYDEIVSMDIKKKDLYFYGEFSENKDPCSKPSISDIYFNLYALKDCLEEIKLYTFDHLAELMWEIHQKFGR